MYNHTVTRTP